MTNRFKYLDLSFPCGEDRKSGEVVGVEVIVTAHGVRKGSMFWKRKAWYVNASVNAFHMHRGLCAEFRTDYSRFCLPASERAWKRILGDIVDTCYVNNCITGEQYHTFVVETRDMIPNVVSSSIIEAIELSDGPKGPSFRSALFQESARLARLCPIIFGRTLYGMALKD